MSKYILTSLTDDDIYGTSLKNIYDSHSWTFTPYIKHIVWLNSFYKELEELGDEIKFEYHDLLLFSLDLDILDNKMSSVKNMNYIVIEDLQIYSDYVTNIGKKILLYNDFITNNYNHIESNEYIMTYLVNNQVNVMDFIGFNIFLINFTFLMTHFVDDYNYDDMRIGYVKLNVVKSLLENNQYNIINLFLQLFEFDSYQQVEILKENMIFIPQNLNGYKIRYDSFTREQFRYILIDKNYEEKILPNKIRNKIKNGRIFLFKNDIFQIVSIMIDGQGEKEKVFFSFETCGQQACLRSRQNVLIEKNQDWYILFVFTNNTINISSKNNAFILYCDVYYKKPRKSDKLK